jgi:DNA-binding response OmpR family regulator
MEPLKILIIEDDPTTCTLLKTTLEMEGYQTAIVHTLENEDIISLLKKEKPDILFLDFYLGAQQTLPYLNLVRQDADWQHLPILMTSAIDHGQDCLAAGAHDFILKPFNWDDLIRKISEVSKISEITEKTMQKGEGKPRYLAGVFAEE